MTKMKLAVPALFLLMILEMVATADPNKIYAQRAEKAFFQAQSQFQSATNNPTNAWNFARTTFDFCEFATNDTQRADIARLGIAACREWLMHEPKSAPTHYYLAMNLGELADAEAPSIAAYRLVHEMESEFELVADLDEHFDFAGAERNLGELYYQAPGWPLSVGSKRKAQEWLERAAALAPNYPGNLLNLAEAQLKWHLMDDAKNTLQKLDELWPSARTNFIGAAWEETWDEWNARRATQKTEASHLVSGKSAR